MKRIGIVGLGLKNPYTYAKLLKGCGAEVVAVYDDYPELVTEYAADFGCKAVFNLDEYPCDVDGVIIDSINSRHLELALYFISKDIPVFIDKPLSNDPDEAIEFIKKFDKCVWFSASPLRFSPLYQKMVLDLIASGRSLQYIRTAVFHTMEHFMKKEDKKWHDDPSQGGGMLVDIGIHAIELLNMFPHVDVDKITYMRSRGFYKDSLSGDNHHVSIRYKDGSMADVDLLCATNHLDYMVEAYTNDGRFYNSDEQRYISEGYDADNAYGGFDGVIAAFLDMVDTKKIPVSHHETLRNFKLIKQILAAEV